MSLIATIGRQTLETRILIWAIYIVLFLGAVTMVYPFMVMVSGSFKTNVDRDDYDVVPSFFYSDTVLYQKHLECKHNNQTTLYSIATRDRIFEFNRVDLPEEYHQQRVADWREFETGADIGPGEYVLGYTVHFGDRLELWKAREFRKALMEECRGDIEEMNRRYDSTYETWLSVRPPEPLVAQNTERRFQLKAEPLNERYYGEFKPAQPTWFRVYPDLDGAFVTLYLAPIYGPDIVQYNAAHGTDHTDYDSVHLTRTVPAAPLQREDWENYVRKELNLQFVRVRAEGLPAFADFLNRRYEGNLDELNRRYGTSYKSFDDVGYPEDYLAAGDRVTDYADFVEEAPLDLIYLTGPQFHYRDFLREKYGGDVSALNKAQESSYEDFEEVPIPAVDLNYSDLRKHGDEIRHEFMTANYRQVFDYVVMHGRSLWNTVIYCLLAITLALTVNPLAAYALSRYNPPSTYKVILFCMATMAFPPAVTMIPNFLLLKEVGLLNTFGALVLPAAANGFSIFLLKGFFDSLPRELYESASLDGAGEWTMFWKITMSLSKPILAVIALGAFTAAYGNFMFAFIVCPSQKMWTLMVFLYQLQIDGHQALTFAALLVAAIPTFLVFLFAQKIIIQGIVVPVEK